MFLGTHVQVLATATQQGSEVERIVFEGRRALWRNRSRFWRVVVVGCHVHELIVMDDPLTGEPQGLHSVSFIADAIGRVW